MAIGRAVLRYLLAIGMAFISVLAAGCATNSKPFRMNKVSPGIYEGYKPRTQDHFDALHTHEVRTILSLEQLPWDIWPERKQARENGFEFKDVPILASPLAPSEADVKEALLILNDTALRPIFVHCLLGEDRCTFIVGLYRIYFQDWTPQAAWQEMLHSGFHVRWSLRGFTRYFWEHTQKPDWVLALRERPAARPDLTHNKVISP